MTVLTPIYEADFLGFSCGFRPDRNQHQALDAVAVGMQKKRVNWVLDADIQTFFDTVDLAWMLRFLEHRIGNKRILRLIRKRLTAGVVERGHKTAMRVGRLVARPSLTHALMGTPKRPGNTIYDAVNSGLLTTEA